MTSQPPSGRPDPHEMLTWPSLHDSAQFALAALLATLELKHIQQQWQRFHAACQAYGQEAHVTETFTLLCRLPEPGDDPVLTVVLKRIDQEPAIITREVSADATPATMLREILLALGDALSLLGY